MTTPLAATPASEPVSPSLFRRGRQESTEYKICDGGDDRYRNLHGTIIPTAKEGHDHSGFRGDTLPNPTEEVLITKDMGGGKGMVTLTVNARAMEILKLVNSKGGKISFEDAMAAEAAERATGVMTQEPETPDSEVIQPSTDPAIEAMVAKVSPAGKRTAKKLVPQATSEVVRKPSKKIPVKFFSPVGSMTLQADSAFVGGPGDVCLVIIQDSPAGEFSIPPQSDEFVNISLNGSVYKCLTGTYYQIPGTSLMHTLYFIHREDNSDEPREA